MWGISGRGLALAAVVMISLPQASDAQGFLTRIFGGGVDSGDLRATIWVDPDGCEHWAIDDGVEGYMSQHLDKSGKPVCRAVTAAPGVCRTFDSAALFPSGSAALNAKSRAAIKEYFASIPGGVIIVAGHTDSIGSDELNLNLSFRRANAVAKMASDMGIKAESRGFGEQDPVADNATAAGRAKNRRVDLHCS